MRLIRASAANLDYFFSNQKDASWLPFLMKEGFFSEPTPPETGTTEEGQTWFRFPNWPESQYLARIATEAPQQVVEAIERIPETPNPRVHEDIIVAATALPGELAARVAKREQRWLAGYEGHLVSLPHSAGDLLAHLAREGETKAAFALAGTLLKIVVDPLHENQTSHHRAVALVGDWEYGEILEKAWPPLMAAEPEKAFRFLRHRLADVIELGFVGGSSFDPTYLWRSAIEDHAQNTGRSLLDTMVEAVRDTAVAEAERGPESRDQVLAELARHDAPLFRRITLFVLSDFGSPEQIGAILTDETLIDEVNGWHEYAELLRKRFGDLDIRQRAAIVSLFAAGPKPERTTFLRERGDSEQQIEAYGRHWRIRRYNLIADHLDGEAKSEYDALLSEFGKPDHPTFLSVISHWTGPTSPYTAEELSAMGPRGIVEALKAWTPPENGSIDEYSKEGLARAVEATVEKEAEDFAASATEFADLDPDYVRALLGGLVKAAREKATFPWGPVLDLCERVAAEPVPDMPAGSGEAPIRWLHRTIVSLLSDGLKDGEAEIPFEERGRVWELIEPHLEDPDPSPARDEESEPATVAINSVRGEALHAAINYAFWVERALSAEESFDGIGSLPEFAAAIDRRLDLDIEPSAAIRAVLGQWFVQFVRMDQGWATTLAPRLFPSDPEEAGLFSAAWNAYVVFNRAWVSVFEILRGSYELAVERFEEPDEDRYMAGNPREHLGEHLIFLRFTSAIDLAADGLFAGFWDAAPVEIRKHVLRDVGWSLQHGYADLSDAVRSEIVETWGWIVTRDGDERESLAEFGAWFGADQLDDGWLLTQGQRLLQQGVPLDPDHVVYGALPRMASSHPREVVELLRLMIVTGPEAWSVLGSVDNVRGTLATVLGSGDENARADAIVVLNLLGARGMSEFRDLIPTTG
ncbi:MAG: hypothetical protein JSS97_04695 [Actinobacteria bacterium]|nr:hypothetical protein [Actinomycetota bacterium]